jgi:hypothetical protein
MLSGDENVLRFSIEYIQTLQEKKDHIIDLLEKINETEVLKFLNVKKQL